MKIDTLNRQFQLWTVLLILIPSLLTMTIYTINQIEVAKQQNLEMISQRIAFQVRLINYWLSERTNDISSLSKMDDLRLSDEKKIDHILQLAQQSNKKFDSLSYIDKDGFFRRSTLGGQFKYPSALNQPYYQQAAAGKDYISDVVIGRNSGRPIINFASPIYNYTGEFQGVLLGSVRTQTLENLLLDNWIGQTGEILLVNSEGAMLTEPRYLDQLIKQGRVENTAKLKIKLSGESLQAIQLGGTGTATWIDYQGNKVLGAYQSMPERGWTIIGSMREAEVLAPLYSQLELMGSGTLLLILLIFPFASHLTSRLKHPIDWLIDQSQRISNDDYQQLTYAVSSKTLPKELRILCQTFIEMGFKIKNTIQLLQEKEAKLEEQVNEIQDINSLLEEEIAEHQTTQKLLYHLNADLENKIFERTRELQNQLELAGRVQNSLLPADYSSSKINIRTLFKPLNLVSGDFYGYHWSADSEKLHGYLIDVTGHSVAAALHTAAINSLLSEIMSSEEAWTLTKINDLNQHLIAYFQDSTFVALMIFTFDFKQRTVTCLSGGINYFMASTGAQSGILTLPGIYLGITPNPEFEILTLPMQHGDTIYFMTDGLYENLLPETADHCDLFSHTVEQLSSLSKTTKNHDDCSALCFEITAFKPFPIFLNFSSPLARPLIRSRIRRILQKITGPANEKIEVVLGEAMANAIKYGTNPRLKINRIGNHLILRVKNDGDGFNGNAKIAELTAMDLMDVMEILLQKESGRGLPIMMAWADKVIYNQKGTEIMLIKNCLPPTNEH